MINKIDEANEVMKLIDDSKKLLPFNQHAMVAVLHHHFEGMDIDTGIENLKFSYATLVQDGDLIKDYNNAYLYIVSKQN
jgi:predicted SAM-dependent methyltransferase